MGADMDIAIISIYKYHKCIYFVKHKKNNFFVVFGIDLQKYMCIIMYITDRDI